MEKSNVWDEKTYRVLKKVRAIVNRQNEANDPLFEKAYKTWELEYNRKQETLVLGEFMEHIPEGRLMDLAIQVHVSKIEEYFRGELYEESRRRSAYAVSMFKTDVVRDLGVSSKDEVFIDPVKSEVWRLDPDLEQRYFGKVIDYLRVLSRHGSNEDIQSAMDGGVPEVLKATPEISEFTASVARFIWEYRAEGGAEIVGDICDSPSLARIVFLVTEPSSGYALRSIAG